MSSGGLARPLRLAAVFEERRGTAPRAAVELAVLLVVVRIGSNPSRANDPSWHPRSPTIIVGWPWPGASITAPMRLFATLVAGPRCVTMHLGDVTAAGSHRYDKLEGVRGGVQ